MERLSKPKFAQALTITENDFNNERIGIGNLLKDVKGEITDYVKEVYNSGDPELIHEYIQQVESMKIVQEDIKILQQEI